MSKLNIQHIRNRIVNIHARNVAAGWWTDPETRESLKGKRPALQLLALVHSEVSEGLEGLRKNLMDDKIPTRPMIEVELADAEIRTYDFMGGFDLEPVMDTGYCGREFHQLNLVSSPAEALGLLHIVIGNASIEMIEGNPEAGNAATMIIVFIHAIGDKFGYDIDGAREEKLAYNLTREDHKIENRVKAGGKVI